jgi:hypothetical protein
MRLCPLLLALAPRALALLGMLGGCGVLSSGAGAPSNPPASGVGPIVPWDDEEGLSWSPPFIFADPAVAVGHPAVLVEGDGSGDAIDCWVELQQGARRVIARMHAPSFEAGFGATEDVLAPQLPWHDEALRSPAVARRAAGGIWLAYLSAGRVGLARQDGTAVLVRDEPVPLDTDGRTILSIALGRIDDALRLVLLVEDDAGGGLLELVTRDAELEALLAGGAPALRVADTGVRSPPWDSHLIEVGLRIEQTPAGRAREDLLLTAALPSVMDFGTQPSPSAVGVATRYLDSERPGEDGSFAQPELPILTGPPYPRGATAVGYRGGVLVLYGARSGARDAIAVARHP